MALQRPDLSLDQLLHLSIYKIYVSTSSKSVSMFLNRKFDIKPRLTTKDVEATYINLHDTENEIWVRAKNMNRVEQPLLRYILADCGVRKAVWGGDLLKTAGPIACLRLSPTQDLRFTETKAGTASWRDGANKLNFEENAMADIETNQQYTAQGRK